MQEEISRYQKNQKTKLAAVVNLKGGLIMLNSTLYLYSKTPQELCNFIHGKKAPRFIIRLKKAFLVRASLSLVFLTKSQLFSLPGCQICCFVTVTCISELLWCCHTHCCGLDTKFKCWEGVVVQMIVCLRGLEPVALLPVSTVGPCGFDKETR